MSTTERPNILRFDFDESEISYQQAADRLVSALDGRTSIRLPPESSHSLFFWYLGDVLCSKTFDPFEYKQVNRVELGVEP